MRKYKYYKWYLNETGNYNKLDGNGLFIKVISGVIFEKIYVQDKGKRVLVSLIEPKIPFDMKQWIKMEESDYKKVLSFSKVKK